MPGYAQGIFFCGLRRIFLNIVLSFRDLIQQIEKLREADRRGFRALNQRFAFGPQSGDAEGHGDAMIAAGVDCGAVERSGRRGRRDRLQTPSTSAPMARRFFATRAMRSDSLTRSSLASRMRMPPLV